MKRGLRSRYHIGQLAVEDIVLRLCAEFVLRTGRQPRYYQMNPKDFDAVKTGCAGSMDPNTFTLHIENYVLKPDLQMSIKGGEFFVSDKPFAYENQKKEVYYGSSGQTDVRMRAHVHVKRGD